MSKGTILTGTPDSAMGQEAEPSATGTELEPVALATMTAMLTPLEKVGGDRSHRRIERRQHRGHRGERGRF